MVASHKLYTANKTQHYTTTIWTLNANVPFNRFWCGNSYLNPTQKKKPLKWTRSPESQQITANFRQIVCKQFNLKLHLATNSFGKHECKPLAFRSVHLNGSARTVNRVVSPHHLCTKLRRNSIGREVFVKIKLPTNGHFAEEYIHGCQEVGV